MNVQQFMYYGLEAQAFNYTLMKQEWLSLEWDNHEIIHGNLQEESYPWKAFFGGTHLSIPSVSYQVCLIKQNVLGM